MTSFATEFPVDEGVTLEDFLETTRSWIENSPHTKLSALELSQLGQDEISKCLAVGEEIQCWTFVDSAIGQESAAIIYTKENGGMRWRTNMVFSKDHMDVWIGIRIVGEATSPKVRIPTARKPRAIEYIIGRLGGSVDGFFRVQSAAHRLVDGDIGIAVSLVKDGNKGRLPIVFLSCGFASDYLVDPNALASDLAGMAHVVVEPSRSFSRILQKETESENVYGGTICIYWPDSSGSQEFYIGTQYQSPRDIKSAILESVQIALSHRISHRRVTVEYVQSLVSRRTLDQVWGDLRRLGTEETRKEIDKYVKEFDRELSEKDERIRSLEAELGWIKSQKVKSSALANGHHNLLRNPTTEQELYDGEFRSIVVGELAKAVSNVVADSRRQHVLQAVLNANSIGESMGSRYRDDLKAILKGYRKMTAVVRSGLERMGFVVRSEGGHHKLIFAGDDRYSFVLPSSGSDVRGSENAISDINRLLF